ncbi:MAG: polyprenyl synthetase family protein, partial [Acidobacteriota bacterium]
MANGVPCSIAEPVYALEFVSKELDLTLVRDKERVDQFLGELLRTESALLANPVSKAMEYATMGTAQRYRPILALRVARMLGAETDAVLRAAAAVELFHSASLIIDDLPCMDDEAMRRGRPAVHRQYGEATAILAAFSMVALSARIVMETAKGGSECMRLRRFQLAL